MLTLQTQKPTEILKEDIDPLAIQKTILAIFDQYPNHTFYKPLFHFVQELTNSRAVFLAEKKKERIDIVEEVHDEDNSWVHITDIIPKVIARVFADEKTQINDISKDGRKWSVITARVHKRSGQSAIGLVVETETEEQLIPFVLILQLIVGYIPFVNLGEAAREEKLVCNQVSVAMELIHHAVCSGDLLVASRLIVEKIQKHLCCQRVILGLKRKWRCQVIAMSDMEEFDKRSTLVKSVESAMQECLREQKMIYYPLPQENARTLQVDISHQNLKLNTDAHCIISVPMFNHQQKQVAVWTFIWEEENPPRKEDVFLIDAITPHVGEVISLFRNIRPNIIARTGRKIVKWGMKIRHLMYLCVLAGIIACLFLPWDHYVTAECQVLPVERYTIAAPFNGVLQSTHCKPGDVLQKGQLLARLDDRELRIELAAAKQTLAGHKRKMTLLFAEEKIADYLVEKMEASKVREKIKLLQYRLAHLEIRSPQVGVVLQGDLERAIGIPVKIGQVLFEVAPTEKLLAEVYIDERDISYVKVGLPTELQVNSYPGKHWQSKVVNISPISQTRNNVNVFTSEVLFDNKQRELLPGMNGELRILIGQKPIWWLWLHRPIAWFREKMWW